jgi:dolichol kinase
LACFVLCLAVEIFLFPIVPGLLDSWNGNFPIVLAIVTALTITLLELFPIRIGKTSINDNLYVPVAAGVVMLFGFPLLG